MTRDEFDIELTRLSVEFEKYPKRERGDAMFEAMSRYSLKDFRAGIDKILDDPERRMFPRIGELKKAVEDAFFVRQDKEWQEAKTKERHDVDSLMATEEGETLIKANLLKVKLLIQGISRGGEGMQHLAEDFAMDTETRPAHCRCNDGIVFYKKQIGTKNGEPLIYDFAAACNRCAAGHAQTKLYPRADPETTAVSSWPSQPARIDTME